MYDIDHSLNALFLFFQIDYTVPTVIADEMSYML